jgi:hypothetical protein
MTKKFLGVFLFLALVAASAKTFDVKLLQPSIVSGTELKAGEYRLDLTNDKVVIANGKQSAESAVKVEQSEGKFPTTTVRYAVEQGKYRVQEIHLRGTKLKLVFSDQATGAGGGTAASE